MIDKFALIIGAMKCGTTSLFRYLSQHPEVAPSTPKEPNFFTQEQDAGRDLDWYRKRWDWNPRTHRVALEASPSYTRIPQFPNAAERIARVNADFYFLYVLRDPIERMESTLRHRGLRGKRGNLNACSDELSDELIAVSKYAMQVSEYTKRFPSERILLLDFEDLKERPSELMERVCRFLEIDASYPFRDLDAAHNVSREDHPAYVALSRSRLARTAVRLFPAGLRRRIRASLSREPEIAPTFSEAQRQYAKRELAEDMKRLRDEFGFDTSGWCHSKADPEG